jgi:hypothetical protein
MQSGERGGSKLGCAGKNDFHAEIIGAACDAAPLQRAATAGLSRLSSRSSF